MPVRFYCSFGGAYQVRNLLVQLAAHHQREYFGLTGGERRDKRPEVIKPVLAPLRRRMAGKRALDSLQQWSPRHRLGQEVFCTGLDGAYTHGNVPMTCPEDDRPVAGEGSKLLLKLQGTQGWHPCVANDATRAC